MYINWFLNIRYRLIQWLWLHHIKPRRKRCNRRFQTYKLPSIVAGFLSSFTFAHAGAVAPSASLHRAAPDIVVADSSHYSIWVQYVDSVIGIDTNTINANNLLITGPAGQLVPNAVTYDQQDLTGRSDRALISGDGSIVGFASSAQTLAPNLPVGEHLFVRDLSNRLIDAIRLGTPDRSSMSADGNRIVFMAPDPNTRRQEVWFANRLNDTIVKISVNANGEPANANALEPAISANGHFAVFASAADNLIPNDPNDPNDGDTNDRFDVFRVNLLEIEQNNSIAIERVSMLTGGAQAEGGDEGSRHPAINADGSVVAYESDATNLASDLSAPAGFENYYVIEGGQTEWIGVCRPSTFDNEACAVDISDDGRWVVFSTKELIGEIPEIVEERGNILLRDRVTRSLQLISGVYNNGILARNGDDQNAGTEIAILPAISGDGNLIAFVSTAQEIVPHPPSTARKLFAFDRSTQSMELISKTFDSVPGSVQAANRVSTRPAINADGSVIAYESEATDLVDLDGDLNPDDANGAVRDIYLHNRITDTTERVSGNNQNPLPDPIAGYSVLPPGGSWDRADNGLYTIELVADTVANAQGVRLAGTTLGQFRVAIGQPPTIDQSDPISATTPMNQTLTVNLSATQLDNDPIHWEIVQGPNHGTASFSTNNPIGPSQAVSYVPNTNYLGADSFVVKISDQLQLYTDSVTVNIQVIDDQPPSAVLSAAPNITTPGGQSNSVEVQFEDNVAIAVNSIDTADLTVTGPSPNQVLNLSAVSVNIDTDGSPRLATYTIDAPGGAWENCTDHGTYTIELNPLQVFDTANRAAAELTLGQFDVAFNTPPSFSQTQVDRQITIDVAAAKQSIPVQLIASDAELDPLTFDSNPALGSNLETQFDAQSNQYSVLARLPVAATEGTQSFAVSATDCLGERVTATINVIVSPVSMPNRAPEIIAFEPFHVETVAGRVDFSLEASDLDGDSLQWDRVVKPNNGVVTVTPAADTSSAEISYQINNAVIDDQFVIAVSDGRGGSDRLVIHVNDRSGPTDPDQIFSHGFE